MSSFRTQLHQADRDAIKLLVEETGVFSKVEAGWAGEVIDAATRNPTSSGYFVQIGDGPTGIEGFTCYGPIEGTNNRFDLYWIAVSPKAQGKGLGQRLLKASIEDAKRRGASHMFIDTSTRSDYAAARALYKSAGFELQGMLVDYYSDGDSKAIYGRKL